MRLVCIQMLVLLTPSLVWAKEYFVDPKKGAAQHPGSVEQPFATLEQAQAAIRALKRKHDGMLPEAVTVLLADGIHPRTAPFVLTPEDSGSSTRPITYAAAPGAKPQLRWLRAITGWQPTTVNGRNAWRVTLPDVQRGAWNFHQLWVNGQRRPRARHPNQGYFRIAALPGVRPDTPRYPGQDRFVYAPGHMQAYAQPVGVEVQVLHLWVGVRLAVKSMDPKQRLVIFAKKSRRTLKDGTALARYRVENAKELLDEPGEWYLDRNTGQLFYLPKAHEQLDNPPEVVAPIAEQFLRIAGKPEQKQFVRYITFRGLDFAGGDWWPMPEQTCDVQAAANVPAVVDAQGLQHGQFDQCRIHAASGYGLHLGRGCAHNTIIRCTLTDLGAGGIRIGEMQRRTEPAEQTHSNIVTDCHVYDLGKFFPQAVGIWLGQTYSNRIAHNHIHDLYYSGISVGWTWGYGPTLCRDNRILSNHIHDLGKELLSDMGGIYTLGRQPNTVIAENVIHDVSGSNYGGWGIYLDEGSSDILVEKNLVYRTSHGGFHQHYGKDNRISGNVFAFGRDAQIRRSRIEDHRSFTFERNLVVYRRGKLLDGRWTNLKARFTENWYWQIGGQPPEFAGHSWAEWQGLGMDSQSKIADPGLPDPSDEKFPRSAEACVAKLGFPPGAWSEVGPRE